jgi:hypothetical protein
LNRVDLDLENSIYTFQGAKYCYEDSAFRTAFPFFSNNHPQFVNFDFNTDGHAELALQLNASMFTLEECWPNKGKTHKLSIDEKAIGYDSNGHAIVSCKLPKEMPNGVFNICFAGELTFLTTAKGGHQIHHAKESNRFSFIIGDSMHQTDDLISCLICQQPDPDESITAEYYLCKHCFQGGHKKCILKNVALRVKAGQNPHECVHCRQDALK